MEKDKDKIRQRSDTERRRERREQRGQTRPEEVTEVRGEYGKDGQMLKGDKQQSMASLRLNNKTAEWWKKTKRDGRGVEEEETSGLSSVCLCVRPGTCSYEKTDISSCYHTGEVDIMSNF